jgi:Tol biopolymer transport system component
MAQVGLLVGFFLTLTLAWYHGERGEQKVSGVELLILAGIMGLGALGLRIVSGGPNGTGVADAPNRNAVRFTLDVAPSIDHGVAISPDGSLVLLGEPHAELGAPIQIWRRDLDQMGVTPVPGSDGMEVYLPSVSPDGDEVAFQVDKEIRIASLDGAGPVRTVASGDGGPTWDEEGYVYFNTDTGIHRVPSLGGEAEQVTVRRDGETSQADYISLGRSSLGIFTVKRNGEPTEIHVHDRTDGSRRFLAVGIRPRITSGGYLLFGSESGQLLAARFNSRRGELVGPIVPVLEGLLVYQEQDRFQNVHYDVSRDGTLIYVADGAASPNSNAEFVWVSRGGTISTVDDGETFDASRTTGWSLSPDGGRVAFGNQILMDREIWTKRLPDGPQTRLTTLDDAAFRPFWSPDGSLITYSAGPVTEERFLWTKSADGAGEPRLVLSGSRGFAQGAWSPDGSWLVGRTAANGPDLPARDIVGARVGVDSVPLPLIATEFVEESPAVSPDGEWIAYVSDESGQPEVYVRSFPNTDSVKVQVSSGGGQRPIWDKRGAQLYFVDGTSASLRRMMSARFEDGVFATPSPLFQLPDGFIAGRGSDFFDVTPDGQRFLMARARPLGSESRLSLVVVQNFFTEMARSLPQ